MIKVEIIADSKNQFGNRITTMVVTFPRIILAEFNTHRMFSRNSASSRAIPARKMIESVRNNPFIPIAFQKDHSGMQGNEYFEIGTVGDKILRDKWLKGRDRALETAADLYEGTGLTDSKVTKQLCNRPLEAYMYHTCIVTATEWENFFALRCPRYELSTGKIFRSIKDIEKWFSSNVVLRTARDTISKPNKYQDLDGNTHILDSNFYRSINKGQAEIHMMALAEAMWNAYNESTPKELEAGEWHIPYGNIIEKEIEKYKGDLYPSDEDLNEMYTDDSMINSLAVKVSTVMAARVSYTTIDTEQSEWTYDKYKKKHDELRDANPKHMSPFEHCARAMDNSEFVSGINGDLRTSGYGMEHFLDGNSVLVETNINKDDYNAGWSGNFRGFVQYRKLIPNENIVRELVPSRHNI